VVAAGAGAGAVVAADSCFFFVAMLDPHNPRVDRQSVHNFTCKR
jgi:hypothetical protein